MSLEDEKESEEVRKDLIQFSKGSVKKEFQVGKWVFSPPPTSQQHQILPAPAGTHPVAQILGILLLNLLPLQFGCGGWQGIPWFSLVGRGWILPGWPLLCSGGGTSAGIPWE